MDFNDPASVERAIGSLGEVNQRAQGILSGARDYLLAQGTKVGASAGLVLSYGAFMVTAGIELGRAAVKAEKAYIDKVKNYIDVIEHGGVDPRRAPKLPPEPAPVVTYEQLRQQELAFDRMIIGQMVKDQFAGPRAEVRRQFDAHKKEVLEKFNKDVLPEVYMSRRDAIMDEISRVIHKLKSDSNFAQNHAEGRTLDERNRSIFDTIHALQDVLNAMKKRKGPLTGEQVRGEIAALQGNRSTGLLKASLDQVFAKERNKFLEKNGVGEDAIDKWYEKAGVSDEVFNKMYKDALREAGL